MIFVIYLFHKGFFYWEDLIYIFIVIFVLLKRYTISWIII